MTTMLELPARLGTTEAVSLWAKVSGSAENLPFDGSAVTHMGVAGLQLLMKTAELYANRGGMFSLLASSELRDCAASLGAADLVAMWETQ